MGYLQTKWVAEKMAWNASALGVPVTVFRPGFLSFNTATGVANLSQLDCLALRVSAAIGAVPAPEAMSRILPNLTPVNFASEAMAQLSLAPDSNSKAFHIASPWNPDWAKWYEELKTGGVPLDILEYPEWIAGMASKLHLEEVRALHGMLTQHDRMGREINLETGWTVGELKKLGLEYPRVDLRIRAFFKFLNANQYIAWQS